MGLVNLSSGIFMNNHSLAKQWARSRCRSIWTLARSCRRLYIALTFSRLSRSIPASKAGFTTNGDTEVALAALQGQTVQQATNTAVSHGRFSEFFPIVEAPRRERLCFDLCRSEQSFVA